MAEGNHPCRCPVVCAPFLHQVAEDEGEAEEEEEEEERRREEEASTAAAAAADSVTERRDVGC